MAPQLKSEARKIYQQMLNECHEREPDAMVVGNSQGLNEWINNQLSWGLVAVYPDKIVCGAKKNAVVGGGTIAIEHFEPGEIMDVEEWEGEREMSLIEQRNNASIIGAAIFRTDTSTRVLRVVTVRGDFKVNVSKSGLGDMRAVSMAASKLLADPMMESSETVHAERYADPAFALSAKTTRSDTRTCPWCAEEIKAAAVLCRFCGRDVPAAEPVLASTSASAPDAEMFASIRADSPRWADEALDLYASLPERPHNPAAWLKELCARLAAGADGPAAASRIPLDWS